MPEPTAGYRPAAAAGACLRAAETSSGRGLLVKLRLLLIAVLALVLAGACTAAVRAISVKAAPHAVRLADGTDGWINGGFPPSLP